MYIILIKNKQLLYSKFYVQCVLIYVGIYNIYIILYINKMKVSITAYSELRHKIKFKNIF